MKKYNHIFQLGDKGVKVVVTNEKSGQEGDEEAGEMIPQEVVDLYGGGNCLGCNL